MPRGDSTPHSVRYPEGPGVLRELLKEETEDIVQAIVEDPTLLLYVGDLLEQLEALRQRAAAAETFIVQMDMAYRYEEFRETWESNPASDPFDAGGQVTHVHDPANSPHEHTWSLPENSGVYRCMTCGVETTDLGAPLPASRQS